jgi:hypothetical protein
MRFEPQKASAAASSRISLLASAAPFGGETSPALVKMIFFGSFAAAGKT